MASLFLSYSSRDRATAEDVSRRLRAQGFTALFIDFDPVDGITAGRSWERELYGQLRRSEALIFLASTSSVNSPWCFAEVSLARSLGLLVVPLRLDEDCQLPLLADVQWVDLAEGEAAFTRLWAGLRRAGLDPSDSFSLNLARGPYPGLPPFAPEDAAVFFGRDQEIGRLMELLQPTLQRGAGRWVAVVGPSGSGKSSLVHAGLLPRLERVEGRWVLVPPMRPGQHPLHELARSLSRAFAARGSPRPFEQVESQLLGQDGAALNELAVELSELDGGRPNVLIVLDQLEELVTRTPVGEQQAFLRRLDAALTDDSPLWVVATLRSEFLSTAPDRAGLAEVIDDSLFLEALSRTRLPEIIERPAQQAGVDFAPGLVGQIVEEISSGRDGSDALPLLAYALRELYERTGRAGTITTEDYAAIGGVVGALQRRADRLLDELTRHGRAAPVLPALMRLAALEGESEPVRRRLPLSAFSGDEVGVIEAFVEARLLTTRRLPQDEATVEVAHEALLRQWTPLRDAIESSRSSLRMRSELERLAAAWVGGERDESYLLRGTRLAGYDAWAREHLNDLGPFEREYIDASRALASKELEAARRSNRRLRLLAVGLAALLILTLGAGGVALQKNAEALSQARVALARQLATQADRLVQDQPDTAILLGLESLSLARGEPSAPGPTAGLITGLARMQHRSRLLTGPKHQVHGVAFSPDDRMVVAGSWDQTLRFWNAETGAAIGPPLTAHAAGVNAVAFSPNGREVASGSQEGEVRLWDVQSRLPQGRPIRVGDKVNAVAFSPDGTLLATASRNRTVRLWRVDTGESFGRPLVGAEGELQDVAFSPDGKTLAGGDWGGTARVWRVDTGEQIGQPVRTRDAVRGVAFSPDGKLLATASGRAVQLWDVRSHRHLTPDFTGHTDFVWSVAFNREGSMLATGSTDRSIRLWDVASRRQRGEPLLAHTADVQHVAFNARGTSIVSGGWDASVRLWDVGETPSIGRALMAHNGSAKGVTFSPDGQILASVGVDGTVQLWSVATGRPLIKPIVTQDDELNRVAFSPDGSIFATAHHGGYARLWDTRTGRPRGQPLKHDDSVQDLAFSADGKLLITGSTDKTVRIWHVPSGAPYGQPLKGHLESVNAVAFSPDGKLAASGSDDQTVRLWDVPTGRPVGHPLTGHPNAVETVAFSRDGKVLVSAGQDRLIKFWDVATGSPRGPDITWHSAAIYQVAFSPDGRLLASASLDGTARLWRADTHTAKGAPLTGLTGGLYGTAFSPDGHLLATATDQGTVWLWTLNFGDWTTYGCSAVGRNLSMAEWNQYVQGIPYERTCSNLPAGEGAPIHAPAAEG